ncbi:MAG: flagellar hook-length control protein FliK [Immundisolibacteraceae bacterium]|nr:flagellar hook-length control protein FliK [Immundisolibacteraceae bacterium]
MIPVTQVINSQRGSHSTTEPQVLPRLATGNALIPTDVLNLRHGSQLVATVETNLQKNLFLLRIGGQHIAASSNLPLAAGEKLLITVDRSGPMLQLRTHVESATTPRLPVQTQSPENLQFQTVDRALRFALPRQQPMGSLIAQLGQLPLDKIDSRISQQLQRLFTQSNSPQQLLKPAQLQQAIINSGTLLEHKLLTSPEKNPASDFKAQLLKTLQQAMSTPNQNEEVGRVQRQVREITESALARIESQQLTTLRDEGGRRMLTTDLLLREGERTHGVEIAIDRQPSKKRANKNRDDENSTSAEKAQHRWQVTLNFDLPNIGKLQSLIQLNSSGLHVDFRTDQPDTRQQLQSNFEKLQHQLTQAGLEDSQLTAGIFPKADGTQSLLQRPVSRPLIDMEV